MKDNPGSTQRNTGGGRTYGDMLTERQRRAGVRGARPQPAPPDNGRPDPDPALWGERSALGAAGARISQSSAKTKAIIAVAVIGTLAWLVLAGVQNFMQEMGEISAAKRPAAAVPEVGEQADQPQDAEPPCQPDEKLRTMETRFLPEARYRGAVRMSVRNATHQIAFVALRQIGTKELATTLVVMPGATAVFPLAGGAVLGEVSVGTEWCNRKQGWKDARRTEVRPMMVATEQTTIIRGKIMERGGGQVKMLLFNESPGAAAPRHFLM